MKLRLKLHAGHKTNEHLLAFTLNAEAAKTRQGRLQFDLDGKSREIDWAEVSPGIYSILIESRAFEVQLSRAPGESSGRSPSYTATIGHQRYAVEVQDARVQRSTAGPTSSEAAQEILAPMPGRIVKILVAENQQVSSGAGLLVIEAMKMQNELRAARSGRVEKIYVREGAGVESGSKLLRLV